MPVQHSDMNSFFRNKEILVTGGTGSIGEQIVSSLLQYRPRRIVVFNKDDSKQYLMKQKYSHHPSLDFQLGDIRDEQRVHFVTRNMDYVFHAAALKQVPVCEDHPFEAIKTNLIGSENVIKAALAHNVRKVVNISTDKAIHPKNVMGATKWLSEKMFRHANTERNNANTIFCSVRFGNVLGSRGSVIPIFLEQVKQNQHLTVTDPDMTRFIMTIDDAAHLTLKAAFYASKGETFILRMKALRILTLLQAIKRYCRNEKLAPPKIKYIGTRPGEKFHEELMTTEEVNQALEDDELFTLLPSRFIRSFLHFTKVKTNAYRSDLVEELTVEELLNYLYEIDAGL